MLARLREKEEALLLGWGVRMPVVVETRRYDAAFWTEMRSGKPKPVDAEMVNKELFG